MSKGRKEKDTFVVILCLVIFMKSKQNMILQLRQLVCLPTSKNPLSITECKNSRGNLCSTLSIEMITAKILEWENNKQGKEVSSFKQQKTCLFTPE